MRLPTWIENEIRKACEKGVEHLPRRSVMKGNGDPYLDRYYVLGEVPFGFPATLKPVLGFLPFAVFLHHIRSSDEASGLHNHPWQVSGSLILAGHYQEERLKEEQQAMLLQKKDFYPGMINLILHDAFHRITLPGPDTWTLFVTGRRMSEWGFRDPLSHLFTPAKKFTDRKARPG